jgi:hypothetical protein
MTHPGFATGCGQILHAIEGRTKLFMCYRNTVDKEYFAKDHDDLIYNID